MFSPSTMPNFEPERKYVKKRMKNELTPSCSRSATADEHSMERSQYMCSIYFYFTLKFDESELKTLEWWISRLILNPHFFSISRL